MRSSERFEDMPDLMEMTLTNVATMNSEEPELEQVRSTPKLINDGIDLVRRHWRMLLRPFLGTVAAPLVSGQILFSLFAGQTYYRMTGGYGSTGEFFSSGSDSTDLLLMIVGILLLFIGLTWGIAFFTALVRASMESHRQRLALTEEHFMAVYRGTRGRAVTGLLGLAGLLFLSLIPFSMLTRALGPMFGMFLFFFFIIALFYFIVRISLFFPARLIEDRGVFDSLGRSSELLVGRWWKTFGLLASVIILITVVTIGTYTPTLLIEMAVSTGLMEPIDPESGIGIAVEILLSALYGLGQAVGQGTLLFYALYFLGRRDALEGSSMDSRIAEIGQDGSIDQDLVSGGGYV